MNFLAHLYLTKDQAEDVIFGNFIADAVKGKKAMEAYGKDVQLGMRIHRAIDAFTDKHPIFKEGTKRLHSNYGKYSGVIMDIYYDHILAIGWNRYSDLPLDEFAQTQYDLIETYRDRLPTRTLLWFEFMKKHDLLYNYSKIDAIDFVLKRMDGRTAYISGMSTAIYELQEYKTAYREEFHQFFTEIREYIEHKFFS